MQYASTSAIRSSRSPGEAQVLERLLVDREEAARRAVLRRHVPDRRAVGEREAGETVAEVLDELADDAGLAQDLRSPSARGRSRSRPPASSPLSLKPTTCGTSIEIASPSIAASASIPPTPQPSTPRPLIIVVCESVPTSVSGNATPVARLDHAREVLEVDLVDDAGARRDDLEVVEGRLAPAQEGVALAVALELELGVPPEGEPRCELVDLDAVVDDELGRDQRVDPRGVAAEIRIASRIAARSTTAGTPVKSCSSTRAGENEISRLGSSVATHVATASTSASVPVRRTFSSRIRSVYGSRATSKRDCSASSRKIS